MSSTPPPGPDLPGPGSHPEPAPWAAWSGQPGSGASAPLSDPLVPPDARGWLDRVVGVVRRSLAPLLVVQLGAAVVSTALIHLPSLLLPEQVDPVGFDGFLMMLTLVLGVAVGAVVQGASGYVVVRDAAGHETTPAEAVRFALVRAPSLIGWSLAALALTAFGALAAIALGALGVLVVVPLLYLTVVFAAALVGVVTVEQAGIPRCLELVNARLWPTVGRVLPAVVLGGIYSFAVAPYLVGVLSEPRTIVEAALQAMTGVPMGIGAIAVTMVTYAELRFHERGDVRTASLAAQLA